MSYKVQQKFIHMAPRKLRLVADVVRGQSVETAVAHLQVMPKIAAQPLLQAIKAAVNAAKQKHHEGPLTVATIMIDEGPALKRRILKSRGRASRMEHRMSHITVIVEAPTAPVKEEKAKRK